MSYQFTKKDSVLKIIDLSLFSQLAAKFSNVLFIKRCSHIFQKNISENQSCFKPGGSCVNYCIKGRNFRDFHKFWTFLRNFITWSTLIRESRYQSSFLQDMITFFFCIVYILIKSQTCDFFSSFFCLLRKSLQLEVHSVIWLYNMIQCILQHECHTRATRMRHECDTSEKF